MGDVIKEFSIRSTRGDRARKLRLYFDTGSPSTFIKLSATRRFSAVFALPDPVEFGGLGDGSFQATEMMHLEVRLLNIWVLHSAYVVDDSVLEEDEDILVGHDFMQRFNIKIDTRRRDVILDRASLKRSRKVRRCRRRFVVRGSRGASVTSFSKARITSHESRTTSHES